MRHLICSCANVEPLFSKIKERFYKLLFLLYYHVFMKTILLIRLGGMVRILPPIA